MTGSRAGVRILSCVAVMLALAACGGEKPEDAATSWSATLQLTAEKWVGNSVPSRFVESTCDSAQKALEKAAKKSDDGDPALKQIEKAIAAAGKLKVAAERGDRKAAREVVEELRR